MKSPNDMKPLSLHSPGNHNRGHGVSHGGGLEPLGGI